MKPSTLIRARVRSQHWLSAVALSVLAVSVLSGSTALAQSTGECRDPWPLRRAMFMYTSSAMPKATLDQIADTFDWVVEGYRPDLQYMLDKRSTLKWVAMYNSLSDNYVVDSDEHRWLMENASNYGLNGEDAYIHFYEDSVVELEGQAITIPGWNPNRGPSDPPASAASPAEARVPVYYAVLNRRVTNFATKAHRDMHRDYNIMRFNQPLVGGHHPGGVMFDNAGHSSLRVQVRSGGGVAEHPTRARMNSPEFVDWYFMNGVRLYLSEIRTYLDNNRSMFGGRQIHVIPNTANVPHISNSSWEESYLSPPAGHILALEFEYNPTRDFGRDLPGQIYEKHTAALAVGVSLFETGYLFTGHGSLEGSFTEDEAVMNNIAGHWVHRADDAGSMATTYILGANVWDARANPEAFARNLEAAFQMDLGRPTGPPFVIQSGVDGKGYSYKVFGRSFSCGFAVVRHRDPYNGDFDASTSVQFDLPGEYTPITLAGDALRPTRTWSLRNGEGQIFLAEVGEPNLVAPAPPTNLREGDE